MNSSITTLYFLSSFLYGNIYFLHNDILYHVKYWLGFQKLSFSYPAVCPIQLECYTQISLLENFIHEMKFMKESGTPTGSFAGKNLLDKPLSNKIYDLSQKLWFMVNYDEKQEFCATWGKIPTFAWLLVVMLSFCFNNVYVHNWTEAKKIINLSVEGVRGFCRQKQYFLALPFLGKTTTFTIINVIYTLQYFKTCKFVLIPVYLNRK